MPARKGSLNSGTSKDILQQLRLINQNLGELAHRLDRVIEIQREVLDRLAPKPTANVEGLPLDVATLLSLPDHLRKTAMAIANLREATASEVSKETGRVRAVESDYLNQLVAMSILRKRRKGREVYFNLGD